MIDINRRNILILVIFNLIILVELCFSLIQASKDPENVFLIFLKYFIFLIIPTFIVGRFIIRRFLLKFDPQAQPKKEVPSLYSDEETLWANINRAEETPKGPLKLPLEIGAILRQKRILERAVILFLILLIVSFFDGCINKLLHPPNLLLLLPGQSVRVNAPLEKKVTSVNELSYVSNSSDITLEFKEIYSGFWLGGTEWRGVLNVSPEAKPGQYLVTIKIKDFESKRPFIFVVRVYENLESLRRSSMSLIKKTVGVSPWLVFTGSIVLIVLSVIGILKCSNKIEKIMSARGQAEIFLVRRGLYVSMVWFPLGRRHNLKPGDVLDLYTNERQPLGVVIVHQVGEENSVGITKNEYQVKPGYLVSLRRGS